MHTRAVQVLVFNVVHMRVVGIVKEQWTLCRVTMTRYLTSHKLVIGRQQVEELGQSCKGPGGFLGCVDLDIKRFGFNVWFLHEAQRAKNVVGHMKWRVS